ncbi:MAG: nucleotidyltransferase [Bacilli bacterium]
MSTGIICEYNPFHNGHLYHINKIKEMFPDDEIILVMSSLYLERGEVSLISKWDKTETAIKYGVDLVIELPFVFSSQGADIFAKGAIEILNSLFVDRLVFGSEINDINLLKNLANIQIDNAKFNDLVKEYISEGINYPTAVSKAIKLLTKQEITGPNDILGVSYIKEIIRLNSKIEPICIKRTNDYHNLDTSGDISSASSIRKLLRENKDISSFVPDSSFQKKELFFTEYYFDFIKYKILSNMDSLNIFQTVDEGIEGRIKKAILKSNNFEELIDNIKSKRYTYNKIRRMLIHILCNFTKEEAQICKNSEYIRVLGFNKKGKNFLNQVKKKSILPIITGYSNIDSKILDIEFRVSSIYYMVSKEKNKSQLIDMEYKHSPIIK